MVIPLQLRRYQLLHLTAQRAAVPVGDTAAHGFFFRLVQILIGVIFPGGQGVHLCQDPVAAQFRHQCAAPDLAGVIAHQKLARFNADRHMLQYVPECPRPAERGRDAFCILPGFGQVDRPFRADRWLFHHTVPQGLCPSCELIFLHAAASFI